MRAPSIFSTFSKILTFNVISLFVTQKKFLFSNDIDNATYESGSIKEQPRSYLNPLCHRYCYKSARGVRKLFEKGKCCFFCV